MYVKFSCINSVGRFTACSLNNKKEHGFDLKIISMEIIAVLCLIHGNLLSNLSKLHLLNIVKGRDILRKYKSGNIYNSYQKVLANSFSDKS